jgi:multiple antibiotic resistance protein
MSFEALIQTFVTLFVVIDPIAVAPLFVALTQGMTEPQRRLIAVRAIAIAFGLLAVFGLAGRPLLGAIGIGLPAFRISGGLLLFLIAVDMLFERRSERRERQAGADLPDPSVFPLATPMIAGPGALATMILLASQHESDLLALLEINLVMMAVLALVYVLFRAGPFVERLLGHTGIVVLTRLFGILLAALAVQFVLNGLRDLRLLPA